MTPTTQTDVIRTREANALRRRVRAIRRKLVAVTLATGLAFAFATAIGAVAAEMLADWRIELPWAVRCVLMAAVGGGLAWWFFTQFCRWPGDDAVALLIERKLPTFRGRFIAAIQLARSRQRGMSAALIRALLAEAAAIEAQLHFGRVVETGRLRKALLIAAIAATAVGGVLLSGNPVATVLFKRALLFHDGIPRKTAIVVLAGDRTAAVGDNIAIDAIARGVVPVSGSLLVKLSSGQTHEFSMVGDPATPSRFHRTLESVQESFSYTIRLNDAETPVFQVTVFPRPTVTGIVCEQVYPAYTHLGSVRRALGNLTLLAGSRLNLKIAASSNISRASVRLAGLGGEAPVRIDRYNPRLVTAAIPIPAKGATGFSIHLTDEHGIASKDSATHRFDIVPDRPPTVKITAPDHPEELVTPQGALLLGYEASDDFGIGKARLHYVVRDGANGGEAASAGPEQAVDLEVPAADTKTIARQFEWKIGAVSPRPKEGSVIEYWIEVADCNDVTGPGIGTSGRYQAKIVTPEEKQAEMAGRLMNSFQGLNDIAIDQEKLNKDVGTIIDEKHAK